MVLKGMQDLRLSQDRDMFNYKNNYNQFLKDPLGQERRFNEAKKTNSDFIRGLVTS